MSYDTDRAWSDQFIPHMRTLIGPHLLVPSSFDVDTKQAADLVVFRARDLTIACRVRRHGYADRYPFEFTVRSARDSGARTELEKLTDGWGDWMFYGHAAESMPLLDRAIAMLGDDVHGDYWRPTEGNAKAALLKLRALALMRPDGVWDGD